MGVKSKEIARELVERVNRDYALGKPASAIWFGDRALYSFYIKVQRDPSNLDVWENLHEDVRKYFP